MAAIFFRPECIKVFRIDKGYCVIKDICSLMYSRSGASSPLPVSGVDPWHDNIANRHERCHRVHQHQRTDIMISINKAKKNMLRKCMTCDKNTVALFWNNIIAALWHTSYGRDRSPLYRSINILLIHGGTDVWSPGALLQTSYQVSFWYTKSVERVARCFAHDSLADTAVPCVLSPTGPFY